MTSLQNRREQLSGNELPLKLLRRGKVRDVYDLSDKLLIVSTDRISAFDWVLPDEITGKGKVLSKISEFCFNKTRHIVANHFIISDLAEIQKFLPQTAKLSRWHEGRSMLVKKTERVDFECVVRGYISGSGWSDYKKTGRVCGITLPTGLKESQKLTEPLFTPASKADTGHDENISFETMSAALGRELAEKIKNVSLSLYNWGWKHLIERGIILADTKFEFGLLNNELILIDEIFTPDSSRFWEAKTYKEGISPQSFDKQFVRDFLSASGWDKNSPPPALPPHVIDGTIKRYEEALERIIS